MITEGVRRKIRDLTTGVRCQSAW